MTRELPLTRASRVLQLAAGAGLLLALVLALRRPVRAESNVGASTVWLLWWPLVPFLALAAGRLWCAVCPFAGLSDLAEGAAARYARRLPWRRRAPGARLRGASAWGLPVAIAVVGVAFLALGLEMSGPLTAAVIGVFAAGSAGMALALRGRAWCRYACPLGATLGLYGQVSAWRLVTRGQGAPRVVPALPPAGVPAGAGPRAAAAAGSPIFRCPALLSPLRAIDPRHCQLCLRCLEAGAATVARTAPGAAARTLGAADTALVVALAGVLVADTVRMTPLFLTYVELALPALGREHYRLAVTLLPLAGIAAVAALAGTVALIALRVRPGAGGAGSVGWRRHSGASFRSAATALVPVALAAQVALSLQHLVGSAGPSLQALAIELLPVPWSGHTPPAEAYTLFLPLKAVQLALLAAAAAYVWRGRRRGTDRPAAEVATPATAVLGSAGFAAMFALPMSLAC